jgi:hypothetical protein
MLLLFTFVTSGPENKNKTDQNEADISTGAADYKRFLWLVLFKE